MRRRRNQHESTQKRRYEKLYSRITYEMDVQKIGAEDMAKEIGVCPATFYNRLSAPGQFRLEELLKLCKCLGLSIEETRNLFQYI